MSIVKGPGFWIDEYETDITCPICTFQFDATARMEKAKLPVFKMRCPGCKSWIGIKVPIFGGTTECFEWDPPKTKENNQLITKSPFRVNGVIEKPRKPYDDNSDEPSDILV